MCYISYSIYLIYNSLELLAHSRRDLFIVFAFGQVGGISGIILVKEAELWQFSDETIHFI